MKFLLAFITAAFLSFSPAQAKDITEKTIKIQCMSFENFRKNMVDPGGFSPIGEWIYKLDEEKKTYTSLDTLVNQNSQFIIADVSRKEDGTYEACVIKFGQRKSVSE